MKKFNDLSGIFSEKGAKPDRSEEFSDSYFLGAEAGVAFTVPEDKKSNDIYDEGLENCAVEGGTFARSFIDKNNNIDRKTTNRPRYKPKDNFTI